MSDFEVTFDSNGELKNWMTKNIRRLIPEMDKAVRNATIFGLTKTKTTLSKRTGMLRRSYNQRKRGSLSREIFSNIKYAQAVEFGYKAHLIKPVRKKALSWKTGGKRFFSKGHMIPRFKGTHKISDIVFPGVKNRFRLEVILAMRRLLR